MRIASALIVGAALASPLEAWACKCAGDDVTFFELVGEKTIVEAKVVARLWATDAGHGTPRTVELHVEQQLKGAPAPKRLLLAMVGGCTERVEHFEPGTRWILALESPMPRSADAWVSRYGGPVPNVVNKCGIPALQVEGDEAVVRPSLASTEIDRGRTRMPLKELRARLRAMTAPKPK